MAGTLSRRSFIAGLAAVAALPWHHRPNHNPAPTPTPTPSPSAGLYGDMYSHEY